MTQKKRLAAYAWSHLCVDALCCFLLYRIKADSLLWIIVYHGIAFAFQPVIGAFTDRHPVFPAGRISITLILAAYAFAMVPSLAVVMAGIGNALFHLEGGYVCLHGNVSVNEPGVEEPDPENKNHAQNHKNTDNIAAGGLFVGPGALGIGLGTIAGQAEWAGTFPVSTPIFLLIFGASAFILLWSIRITPALRSKRVFYHSIRKGKRDIILVLVFFSIVIRGYGGFLVSAPELNGLSAFRISLLTPFVLSMLGKMTGGLIADRFGIRRTAVWSQIAAAAVLLAGWWLPVSWLCYFLVNIPMAATLAALSDCLPENTGVAFGLAPLGLFIGYILHHAVPIQDVVSRLTGVTLILVSAGMLGLVLSSDCS
ncbi:MAG: hypothetical protein ACI4ET_14080 [Bilifractor sp.]